VCVLSMEFVVACFCWVVWSVDVCVFVCVGVACGKREDPLMCYEE